MTSLPRICMSTTVRCDATVDVPVASMTTPGAVPTNVCGFVNCAPVTGYTPASIVMICAGGDSDSDAVTSPSAGTWKTALDGAQKDGAFEYHSLSASRSQVAEQPS